MELTRRTFLNRSAVGLVGGAALSSICTVAMADGAAAVPPTPAAQAAPATTAAIPMVNVEGNALADLAAASAGYPLTPVETAEVVNQLDAYPGSVKDLRAFALKNSDAPNMNVTPSLRPPVDKSILGIKL